MNRREIGDERTAVWSSSMDAPEALRAINTFSRAIIKDIIHNGWSQNAGTGPGKEYDWVYHVHLTRTYRRKQAFPNLVLDVEQPDNNGDHGSPFPATQPTDTISDLWGGSGGAQHSSPAGLLGSYDNPELVKSNDNSRTADVCTTEACEEYSTSVHNILSQGRTSVGDWPPG